jgi:hypothetical protein
MKYIKMKNDGMHMYTCENGQTVSGEQLVIMRYFSLINQMKKELKLKKYSAFKRKVREILWEQHYFHDKNGSIIVKLGDGLSSNDILQDPRLKHTSRYFFSESHEIPYALLQEILSVYTVLFPKHSSMPTHIFKLIMVIGMRIASRNPVYLTWYFQKVILHVSLPRYVARTLEGLLDKTLAHYPDSLNDPEMRKRLIMLHHEFAGVLETYQPASQAIGKRLTKNIRINMLSRAGQAALNYVWKFHLNKLHERETSLTYFPILYFNENDEADFSSARFYNGYIKGKHDYNIVYRSNHGLVHTSCTLYYVHAVLEFNRKHALLPIKTYLAKQLATPEASERWISKLQIALAFYVSGREGEHAFGTPEYSKYRAQSAENFVDYINRHPEWKALFHDEAELLVYKNCLETPFLSNENTELLLDNARLFSHVKGWEAYILAITLQTILLAAHCADLVRLWDPKKIATQTIDDLMRGVDKADKKNADVRHEALLIFKIAASLNLLMGSSVKTDYDIVRKKCIYPKVKCCDAYDTPYPKTDLKKFIQYSVSPAACIELLNSVTQDELLRDDMKPCLLNSFGLFAQPAEKACSGERSLSSTLRLV